MGNKEPNIKGIHDDPDQLVRKSILNILVFDILPFIMIILSEV